MAINQSFYPDPWGWGAGGGGEVWEGGGGGGFGGGAGDVPFFYGGHTGGGSGFSGGGYRNPTRFSPPGAPAPPGASSSGPISTDMFLAIIRALTGGGTGSTGNDANYGVTPGGYLAELQRLLAPPTGSAPPAASPSSTSPPVAAATSATAPKGTALPPQENTIMSHESDTGSSSGSSGGFDWSQFLNLLGTGVSAYGAYSSNRSNQRNASRGPVLPADVQPARDFLGQLFLQMLSTPGGLDYGATPFPLNLGETDPFAAVNQYRTSSAPAFTDELNKALDTEKAKLGGQYGIRFGTDLQRGLGDTVASATASREATLGQLGVSAYDSFMQRRLAELGLRTDDYRKQKGGYLPLIANYLGGQPSSSPYSGGSPAGQAFQALGGGLANAPIYQYLNSQD